MKYLVTGAAGFIGSTLVEHLLTSGDAEVVGVDALTDYYDPALKRANLARLESPRLELVKQDINHADLDALLNDVDVVFHLAGQPGVRKSWGEDFSTYVDCNIGATQKLLEAAGRASGLRAFINASSSSVYGDAERFPTLETDRPQPRSPYGVTKLAAEHLCGLYAQNFGVPTVSLRFFTVYGPRQRPDMAFTRFVRAAHTGEEICVFGDGTQIRDFTYVSDIVRAMALAAERPCPPGTVMNLSGGSSVSVNDVIDLLRELVGRDVDVAYGEPVPGDVLRTGGSSALTKELLGWTPEVSLEDGLRSQLNWMAQHLDG